MRNVPPVVPLAVAAKYLSAPTGRAVRVRFSKGLYPPEYLANLTPRKMGVRLQALLEWLAAQPRRAKAAKAPAPQPAAPDAAGGQP
jgi:hypothetical protein